MAHGLEQQLPLGVAPVLQAGSPLSVSGVQALWVHFVASVSTGAVCPLSRLLGVDAQSPAESVCAWLWGLVSTICKLEPEPCGELCRIGAKSHANSAVSGANRVPFGRL